MMKKSTLARGKNRHDEPARHPDEVRILSFDVGHGDCTLIEYRQTGTVAFRCLVDGGAQCPEALLKHLRDNPRRDGAKDIDVLVLSHVDSDHQDGLPGLIGKGIGIGEYLGPCLPTFRRLEWLFPDRVQKAVKKAAELEQQLVTRGVPVIYPLEGFVSRYANRRVSLSVLSPAPRLIEKLSLADGGELSNLLGRQPLPLEWLLEAEGDEPEDDNAFIKSRFRSGIGLVTQDDFSRPLPAVRGVDANEMRNAAKELGAGESFEPDFFGNSVLNDTSLVVALDVHLDGKHRRRILLTGDQENWSYLAARHAGGLGVDVLKSPHHGGRVYLEGRQDASEALYLWLRPRVALVSASANGKHDLPRADFRNAMRSVGATLICHNARNIEPLTAGYVHKPDAKCCCEALCCARPPRESAGISVILAAKGEYSTAPACVQGITHGGPAPIVVHTQNIVVPSEAVVRYTRGELENHARWIKAQLEFHHAAFKEHAAEDQIDVRVNQHAVSWKCISAAAREDKRHPLVAAPFPVLQFARAQSSFWVQGNAPNWNLYRLPTERELARAKEWLLGIPRILLDVTLDERQRGTKSKLDILLSAEWEIVDKLLAAKLAVPHELVSDVVRPGFLLSVGEKFAARMTEYNSYPSSQCRLLLEHHKIQTAFPDIDDGSWEFIEDMESKNKPWRKLGEKVAADSLLMGITSVARYREHSNWRKLFGTQYYWAAEKLGSFKWEELW